MSTLRQTRFARLGMRRRANFDLPADRACVQASEPKPVSPAMPRESGATAHELVTWRSPSLSTVQARPERSHEKALRIMKFGGTSVADSSCISRVAEIIRVGLVESSLVVVVSAMSGVTNKLIDAGKLAETGDHKQVGALFRGLREQHEAVVSALIKSPAQRKVVSSELDKVFCEGDELLRRGLTSGKLKPQEQDAIAGLGERLSAPLVAAVLVNNGIASQAVEATELVITNAQHGGADPCMHLTRERCKLGLQSLLRSNITPVVTGFIGATAEGEPTTLGRGGSDYSATIVGAALDADEVIIWTDVDGVLTADPRLVSGARTIPEISYREAADLAHFGAKVLHPKTLRPVMLSEIPVWIRNTFAPDRPGTKITPSGASDMGGVKAVTAISDVALISVGGTGIAAASDVLGRTFTTAASVSAEVLLISQSSSQNEICFVIPAALAKRTAEALRREFAADLAHEEVEHVRLNSAVAIVAVVGCNICDESGIAGRVLGALSREHINILAMARDASEGNVSFLVARKDLRTALLTMHRELQLGESTGPVLKVTQQVSII